MINIPVLRWGEPYESLDTEEVIHHRTGEVLAKVGQANPGLLARDMRKANRAREVLREIPIKDLVRDDEEGRRPLSQRDAAAGRWRADAGRLRAATVRFHRVAGTHVQVQHGKKPLRVESHGPNPRRPHARAGHLHPRARLRRGGTRRAGKLSGAVARTRHGAAEQFARCAHAVDAGHPDADRSRAQTRPAGAVDALPHVRRLHRGRRAQGSHRHLSRRRRHGRGDGFALRPRV